MSTPLSVKNQLQYCINGINQYTNKNAKTLTEAVEKLYGVKRLDYIETTGTQYIDTLYTPNNNTMIETKFVLKTANSGLYASDSNGSLNTNCTAYISSGGNFRFGNKSVIVRVEQNKIAKTLQSKDGVYLNDTLVSNYTNISTFTSTQTLKLGFNTTNFVGEIFYQKIWDDGVLVRYLIPAKDSNNVVCFFDLVEYKFYYNAGTGDFVAGYEELE